MQPPPPNNQSYGPSRQSSYVNNGNSRGRGGRKYSTGRHYNSENRYNSGSGSNYGQSPPQSGYNHNAGGNSYSQPPQETWYNRNASGNSYSQSPNETWYNRNASGNSYGPPPNPSWTDRRISSSGGGPPFVDHQMNDVRHDHANAGLRNQSHDNSDRRDTASSNPTLPKKPACKNAKQRRLSGTTQPWHKEYVPCPCEHCISKDRTVFVGGFRQNELANEQSVQTLKKVFAQFGSIRNYRVGNNSRSIEFE